MKSALILMTVVLIVSANGAPSFADPPAPQTLRVNLQQHDLSIAGWDTVQSRVDFPTGAVAPRHFHPGEEIIYVLQGSIEYDIDGQPPATLKAGDVLFIPKGVIHSAKNVGAGTASELATYVVEKGKPLLSLAE